MQDTQTQPDEDQQTVNLEKGHCYVMSWSMAKPYIEDGRAELVTEFTERTVLEKI